MAKTKINETEFVGTAPTYKGNGVDIWEAKDKKGRDYLRVKVLGHTVACFRNEKKN